MNTSELRGKSVEDLNKDLFVQLEEQFKLRMQKNTGQLNQSHLLRENRHAIARIKTVLREKAGN